MIVRLSNDKWVNTERICSISKEGRSVRDGADVIVYGVAFDSTRMTLSQTQGEELLSVLPVPYDAEYRRKRKQAEATLVGQLGHMRWVSMSEDERYDAVSDEVERMNAMQAQEQAHD